MAKSMFIDAAYKEETRVAVLSGQKLEEFEFETAAKKQIKGNIYLAKIVRIEPSLQAIFVDYGGNRHGFLGFSEIHPDYYQISPEEYQKVLEEEGISQAINGAKPFEAAIEEASAAMKENGDPEETEEEASVAPSYERLHQRFYQAFLSRYKIENVLKQGQILLVQVEKEERGVKGVTLTTYVSLAGRYCVLMPNTMHGGGVSRKIYNLQDRRRLRDILQDLHLPLKVSLIVRTAGAQKSYIEIERDYEFLSRLWNMIREKSLQSMAPALVYEEANLIKRAIRDMYTADMEHIYVEGEEAYENVLTFMRLLTPSHVRKVECYKDNMISLFNRYRVEESLYSLYNPNVSLPSGGYLVINQTEALVAIDVNSGRSTKQKNVQDTAFTTNMEAAKEVVRQLRLRDLSGLIVIDFIDMSDGEHNQLVERCLRENLQQDKARTHVTSISALGLLELSRQRLHSSWFESHFEICSQCNGVGSMRSSESYAIQILREIERESVNFVFKQVSVAVPSAVALYLLNNKRSELRRLEKFYGMQIVVEVDEDIELSEVVLSSRPLEAYEMSDQEQSKKTDDVAKLIMDMDQIDENLIEAARQNASVLPVIRRRSRRGSGEGKILNTGGDRIEGRNSAGEGRRFPKKGTVRGGTVAKKQNWFKKVLGLKF